MTTTVEPDDEVDAARTPVGDVRHWLAGQIRSKVVGNDAAGRGAAIFDGPGPRWLADDSPARTVHGDASMFVGGLRALLLQSLAPAGHGRRRRALRLPRRPVGPAAADRRLHRRHDVRFRRHGRAGRGHRPPRPRTRRRRGARRPAVRGERPAPARLGAPRRDRQLPHRPSALRQRAARSRRRPTGTCTTSPARPARSAWSTRRRRSPSCSAQLAAFRPELRSTAAARRAARYLIFEPPLPLVVRPAYLALASAAVSLLPALDAVAVARCRCCR